MSDLVLWKCGDPQCPCANLAAVSSEPDFEQLGQMGAKEFDLSDGVPTPIETEQTQPATVLDGKIAQAEKKPPLDMIPLRALKGPSRVLKYGCKKYKTQGNFLNASVGDGAGGRYHGADLRHLSECQTLSGVFTPESLAALDDESGLPHIDHMICGLLMLRAILIKDGVLPEDPGPGNEPPK